MTQKQHTINNSVSVSGVGLHTGEHVNLTFRPAPENHGIKFMRTDIDGSPLVDADIDNVFSTVRGTNLRQNGVVVNTVEHSMAALSGMELDNVLVEIDGPEIPIMDGSSAVFIEALNEAGAQEQKANREYFDLTSTIHYRNPDSEAEILCVPSPDFRVTVMVDYDSHVLCPQHATMENISEFSDKIASSRTFVFLHELEELARQNLIKGGDLDNAIVIVDKMIDEKKLKKLSELFNKPEVKVRKEGILNNVKLKFQNEPARHKLLDVVGDLALIGMPVNAHIIATKPGHTSNVKFALKIKRLLQKEGKRPVYDESLNSPLFDINQIKRILPHRYPFLLIDKILEMSENHVVGVKNVTINEPYFRGHFPGNPIMPGVLQVEAMAQTGGIFVLNTVPDPENYITYFLKIDKVKFKTKVVPGDTLIFRLKLLSPIRRGICHMKGVAYVRNRVAVEGELMAQIVKKEKSNSTSANIKKHLIQVNKDA